MLAFLLIADYRSPPELTLSHDPVHTQSFSREDIVLFWAALMLVIALYGTVFGKLPGRFGESASRAENPGQYWSTLAGYYLAAIAFSAFYFYLVNTF